MQGNTGGGQGSTMRMSNRTIYALYNLHYKLGSLVEDVPKDQWGDLSIQITDCVYDYVCLLFHEMMIDIRELKWHVKFRSKTRGRSHEKRDYIVKEYSEY